MTGLIPSRQSSSSRHNSPASRVITAYKPPSGCGSRQASNAGPRHPWQIPNENLGNAARNCSSSAHIRHGTPGRRPRADRQGTASHTASWCLAGSPGRLAISPRHTVLVRRHRLGQLPGLPRAATFQARLPVASAAPRVRVPITRARRERRNFHPRPRHDGQAAVPATLLSHDHITDRRRRAHPTRYTPTGYKLAISHAASTHGHRGRRTRTACPAAQTT